MKIVCDACSAKYSIADDKVKGKVFKIRCKKCSNIIVVRGNAGGVEESAAPAYDQKETRVYDYQGYDESGGAPAAEDAVWHLVIDQEQVGPLTAADVQRRFSAQEIDGDTYIWREGFADWQPLSAVDAFSALFGGGEPAAAAPTAAAGGAMFGGADDGTARSDAGDLFGAAGGADDAGDDAGADLFGGAARGGKAAAASGDAALFGGGGGGGAAAAAGGAGSDRAAKQAADKRLRGERNENSVLFSLNNLAALASDQPRAPAPSASAPTSASASSSGMAQQGGGEGSGLIDIRSMASTYLSDKGSAKAKPAVGSIDDLPVFSTSAFSEPAVIMPSPSSSSTNNKLLYALIGVVGLLAVVAVVLVVVVFAGGNKDKGTQVAVGEPPAGGTPAAGGAGEPPAPTPGAGAVPAVEPPKEEPKAEAPKEEPKAEEPKEEPKSDRKSDRASSDRKSDRKTDSRSEPKADKPKPEPKESGSSGGGCLDEVGCLLADKPPACCSKYGGKAKGGGGGSKPSGGGGGDSDLPETLDRAMISTGVGKVRGRVEACGSRSSAKGEVKVSVKVAPNGSVSSVSVKSSPDATLGSCVSSAMEKASFSKTQNGGSFSYPFIFR